MNPIRFGKVSTTDYCFITRDKQAKPVTAELILKVTGKKDLERYKDLIDIHGDEGQIQLSTDGRSVTIERTDKAVTVFPYYSEWQAKLPLLLEMVIRSGMESDAAQLFARFFTQRDSGPVH